MTVQHGTVTALVNDVRIIIGLRLLVSVVLLGSRCCPYCRIRAPRWQLKSVSSSQMAVDPLVSLIVRLIVSLGISLGVRGVGHE